MIARPSKLGVLQSVWWMKVEEAALPFVQEVTISVLAEELYPFSLLLDSAPLSLALEILSQVRVDVRAFLWVFLLYG